MAGRIGESSKDEVSFFKKLHDRQDEFQAGPLKQDTYFKAKDGKQAYQEIKSFNAYQAKKYIGYSVEFKVTDSLITSYYVSLPSHYNPKKSYPVLFFLHGAVSGNGLSSFQNASWVMDGWNRYYTKYAAVNEVIMVYPKGSKKFNWMKPDDGFFMVPAMLKEIKKSINVDDDKVFIAGHSNGATGSFSYLMKQQSPFAGFYGFNTQPKVRTGGTFVRNILNRSFFNVSTDEDYYFPPDANDSLNLIMKKMGADYQDHRYKGWPHWFPQFDESEPAYQLLFKDLKSRTRNPFQKSIYWECDDVKYGKTDWIQITALDTVNKPADWHKIINFDIFKVVDYDQSKDTVITTDTLFKAFNFPRKSGAVRATFSNNEFHIETSQVKSLTIFLSPEMIDVSKPVSVFINGVKRTEKMAVYDKKIILDNFNKTYDRKAVWIDQIELLISN
ncbi:alpha/beta hydrolase-fold protein [Pedobacter sp. P26]|uniref:alpha/beta hydrolase-fold protein n=1 Tax=Pedobacter sp. P26 TaxID=3423956 RepID=UPI003D665F04